MIPRPTAKALVARFSGRPGYPQTTEGLKALVDAFQACQSEEHGAAVAADLEVDATFCPTSAEIYRSAQATAKPRQVGCEDCDYTGWQHVQRGAHSAVKPCGCRGTA